MANSAFPVLELLVNLSCADPHAIYNWLASCSPDDGSPGGALKGLEIELNSRVEKVRFRRVNEDDDGGHMVELCIRVIVGVVGEPHCWSALSGWCLTAHWVARQTALTRTIRLVPQRSLYSCQSPVCPLSAVYLHHIGFIASVCSSLFVLVFSTAPSQSNCRNLVGNSQGSDLDASKPSFLCGKTVKRAYLLRSRRTLSRFQRVATDTRHVLVFFLRVMTNGDRFLGTSLEVLLLEIFKNSDRL